MRSGGLAFSAEDKTLPNAVWTGSLSLGMVVVPVRLYPAIRKKAVRFHELDRRGGRVRHVRVSEPEPETQADWEPPTLRLRERAPDLADELPDRARLVVPAPC